MKKDETPKRMYSITNLEQYTMKDYCKEFRLQYKFDVNNSSDMLSVFKFVLVLRSTLLEG